MSVTNITITRGWTAKYGAEKAEVQIAYSLDEGEDVTVATSTVETHIAAILARRLTTEGNQQITFVANDVAPVVNTQVPATPKVVGNTVVQAVVEPVVEPVAEVIAEPVAEVVEAPQTTLNVTKLRVPAAAKAAAAEPEIAVPAVETEVDETPDALTLHKMANDAVTSGKVNPPAFMAEVRKYGAHSIRQLDEAGRAGLAKFIKSLG